MNGRFENDSIKHWNSLNGSTNTIPENSGRCWDSSFKKEFWLVEGFHTPFVKIYLFIQKPKIFHNLAITFLATQIISLKISHFFRIHYLVYHTNFIIVENCRKWRVFKNYSGWMKVWPEPPTTSAVPSFFLTIEKKWQSSLYVTNHK